MAKILNLVRLDRKLARLPLAAREAIKAAMALQADKVVAMMKSLAPVSSAGSHGGRPGELRDSIGWTWGKAPKGAAIVAQVKSSLGSDLTITIYAGSPDAFYARWQEFGTQDAPAQPYFYVSWRASRRGAKRKVRAAVRKAARQVASGG